jgi:hypothetical protein
MGRGLGRSEETGRDEPVGVVIHICMGTTQGSSPCNYLYLNLAKMASFSFIFYAFSFTKSENRRAEQVLVGVSTSERGWVAGKGVGG